MNNKQEREQKLAPAEMAKNIETAERPILIWADPEPLIVSLADFLRTAKDGSVWRDPYRINITDSVFFWQWAYEKLGVKSKGRILPIDKDRPLTEKRSETGVLGLVWIGRYHDKEAELPVNYELCFTAL